MADGQKQSRLAPTAGVRAAAGGRENRRAGGSRGRDHTSDLDLDSNLRSRSFSEVLRLRVLVHKQSFYA